MKNILKLCLLAITISGLFYSCKDDDDDQTPAPTPPNLVFKFKFDSTQVRLDGFGNPATLPAGHGAQSPRFNKMSSHYIELAPSALTALGTGTVVYKNAETTAGGSTAINFSQSILAGNGEQFFSIPISQVAPGTYKYLRVSLAYQNYNINFRTNVLGTDYDLSAAVASFIGYNTYLTSYKIKDSTVAVNGNRAQGYWAFEVLNNIYNVPVISGQAPAGATTVPNPNFATSPIPAGSCVVTGAFTNGTGTTPLTITGNETGDVVVTVSLSTNKSFEWAEHSATGYYEPAAGDTVVDMGIRGLIPVIVQ